MDDEQVRHYWEENARTWTLLARMGCDVTRDNVNTPAFLSILPDVKGLCGLDIGCGEGHNTRQVVKLGARMSGIDISETFIRHAIEEEASVPLGINYIVSSALKLPFPDSSFDFATAFMSLMDMPQPGAVLKEAFRVIKKVGFLQFSILHPCFASPPSLWVRDEQGKKVGRMCSDYFKEGYLEIEEWIFHKTPAELKAKLPRFRVPRFHFTISSWMNMISGAGFFIEEVHEPYASDEVLERIPGFADTRITPENVIIRCRKR